jgi:hypothetical protein
MQTWLNPCWGYGASEGLQEPWSARDAIVLGDSKSEYTDVLLVVEGRPLVARPVQGPGRHHCDAGDHFRALVLVPNSHGASGLRVSTPRG